MGLPTGEILRLQQLRQGIHLCQRHQQPVGKRDKHKLSGFNELHTMAIITGGQLVVTTSMPSFLFTKLQITLNFSHFLCTRGGGLKKAKWLLIVMGIVKLTQRDIL